MPTLIVLIGPTGVGKTELSLRLAESFHTSIVSADSRQLYAELKAAGCYVVRHGGEHDVWFSPKTGKKFSIPRHGSKEVSLHIERNARKVLGI